ncbi:MAG: hypothetical protein Q7S16_05080 [bacterium]|nr:hypothetical protein [bacterium]
MPDHGKTVVEWKFSEFENHERGTAWYFWTTLVGGILLLWAIFSGNFLFALILVLVALLLMLYERRGARIITCVITDTGIVVDETLHRYKDITNFRIVYQPPTVKKLYLAFPSALRPRLTIAITDQNPLALRKILQKHLTEDLETEGEPLSDTLSRIFKI